MQLAGERPGEDVVLEALERRAEATAARERVVLLVADEAPAVSRERLMPEVMQEGDTGRTDEGLATPGP